MAKLGIIGGSGVYQIDSLKTIKEHYIPTPFGETSDAIIEAQIDGATCFFLARHGRKHNISPSEVNFRANIYAMKKLGVTHILSVSAVGSLKEELPPTKFVLVDQFIDWTKGLRKRTFFDEGMVGHVSVAYPIEKNFQNFVANICEEEKIDHAVGGSYICIEGPQFSSRAESEIYRSFGASVIGMTNVPESYLAKEAGIAYVTIAMVTDYDCWKAEHCTVDEIMRVMKTNTETAKKLLTRLIPSFNKSPTTFEKENGYAIITSEDRLSTRHKEIRDILLS